MKTRIMFRAFGCLLIACLAAALAYGEPITWNASAASQRGDDWLRAPMTVAVMAAAPSS